VEGRRKEENVRFHDRAVTMRPDAGVLVPLAVLFVSSLTGPTVPEAWRNAVTQFFTWGPGLVMWVEVVLLNLALYAWFMPVFRVHIDCMGSCDPSQPMIDLAMRRLNRSRGFSICTSILVFVAGRAAMILLDPVAVRPQGLAELPLLLIEAVIAGFFVGVIIALQFETRLFEARRTILRLGTGEKIGYTSLFSKVVVSLVAIILFMTVQTFYFAGSFYSGLRAGLGDGLPALPDFMTGPDFIFHTQGLHGAKEAFEIFLLRLLVVSGFFVQMLWQIRHIIVRPIATIRDRLSSLNSAAPVQSKTIGIVWNDEFAPVFREVNSLIQRQQGEVDVSRKRLEDMIAFAADPILSFDTKGSIRLCNAAAAQILRYDRDAIVGSSIATFLGGGVDDFIAAHAEGVARMEWRDSAGRSVLMESQLSQGGSGEEAWTTVILRDIRQRVELEENLRRARVEAENASRMKSEFLANMSHELRTPLNAILGFTQLLGNDRNLTESQQERVRIITRSGEHLLALINDILDISKIESGKMDLHPVVFDLHEFIADIRDMFELRCKKKGLSLYSEILEELPRYVRGDLGKLRQVMVNLVGNAVKFTAEGGIGILAGVVSANAAIGAGAAVGRREGDGLSVRFAVRDTGRGIPESEQELILQPFVQASTTDHEGGTGLGLAISSRFIAMMGGSLAVESRQGEGSTFSFSIPLELSAEAPVRDDDDDLEIRVAGLRRAKALVVDDQESNRLVLREMLERAGFQVDESRDGREAVSKARETRPDIVFMDIKMPVMDGYQAVAELRKDPITKEIRVFALTASAFSHDEKRIAEAGFDGFLAKPFKQASLYRLVRERGGIELVELRRNEASKGVRPGKVDFGELGRIDPPAFDKIREAALINDFSSLADLASGIEAVAPTFALALRAAASAYDEDAIASLLERAEGGI
jgi:PAS domain S-box-containing protein